MSGILNIAKKLLGDNVAQFLPIGLSKVRFMKRQVESGLRSVPLKNVLQVDDGSTIESQLNTDELGAVTVIAGLRYLCIGYENVGIYVPVLRGSIGVHFNFELRPDLKPRKVNYQNGIGISNGAHYQIILFYAQTFNHIQAHVVHPNGAVEETPIDISEGFNIAQFRGQNPAFVGDFFFPSKIELVSTGRTKKGLNRFVQVASKEIYPVSPSYRVFRGFSELYYTKYTEDGGKTWTPYKSLVNDIPPYECYQYCGEIYNIGNDTFLYMTGYQRTTLISGPPAQYPQVPDMARSIDAGKTWTTTRLDSLFSWVDDLVDSQGLMPGETGTVTYRESIYSLAVTYGQIIPLGDNKIAITIYRPTNDFLSTIRAWDPYVTPFPLRFTEVWVYRSYDNGVTFDEGNYIAKSYINAIPLGNGGLAIVAVEDGLGYVGVSVDEGRTWRFSYTPVQYPNDGEPYDALRAYAQAVPLGAFSRNPDYVNYLGVSQPNVTLITKPIPDPSSKKIDPGKVHLAVPSFYEDGYYLWETFDSGDTWKKNALISPLKKSPQEMRGETFNKIVTVCDSGSIAFPNLNNNDGKPL
jgi:hypothetical protein